MASAPQIAREPTSTSGSESRAQRQLIDWRPWLWLAALILFVLATAGALLQKPRADPLAADENFWQYFSQPLERNAFARLMATDATLTAVHALDQKRVWVVGSGGVILFTEDGGQSWQQGEVKPEQEMPSAPALGDAPAEPGTPAPQPAPAKAAWLSWLGEAHASEAPAAANSKSNSKSNVSPSKAYERIQNAAQRKLPEPPPEPTPPEPTNSKAEGNTEPAPQGFDRAAAIKEKAALDARQQPKVDAPPALPNSLENARTLVPDYAPYQISEVAPALNGVSFANAKEGWAVGQGGSILHSSDAGRSWKWQGLGVTSGELFAVFAASDAKRVWAVGAEGEILATTDGGRRWRIEREGRPNAAALRAIHGVDAGHLYAAGDLGVIVQRDDSRGWLIQSTRGYPVLHGLHFSSPESGMAVGVSEDGKAGVVLSTSDGGRNWQALPSAPDGLLLAAAHAGSIGVVAGEGGIWRLDRQTLTKPGAAMLALQFLNAQNGWAVGTGGTILQTVDGGLHWQARAGGMNTLFGEVRTLTNGNLLAKSRGNALLLSSDAGASWQVLAANDLRRKAYEGAEVVASIVGNQPGRFMRLSSTSGAAALPVSSDYRRLPAPWCWLLWAASLLLALMAAGLKPPPAPVGTRQASIEDLLAPDRPLRPGDPDPLGAGAVARSLASFMANRATEPPLSIAITGEWGTGKSSVMRLLQHQVEARDFRTVWFNAWHHQKGEQLLASLFANIREQGVPRLLSLAGPGFYWRLAQKRLRRRWFVGLMLLGPLAACWGFVLGHDDATGVLENIWKSFAEILKSLSDFKLPETTGDDWRKLFLGGGAVLPLLLLMRVLKAFGVDAGSLMKGAEQVVKPGSMEAQASARYRFAQEFAEVTSALADRRLVIFVDDLDRCDKDNVVEMLETLNFLVCSGECFVVLGLARSWVETCIKLKYAEMAKSGAETSGQSPEDFARNYLEKLINIEVPVPQPPARNMAERLMPGLAGSAPALLWPRLKAAASLATPWVLLGAGIVAAFVWGSQLQWRPSTPEPVIADPCGNYAESISRVLAPQLGNKAALPPEPQHVDCVSRLLAQQLGAKSKAEAPAATPVTAAPVSRSEATPPSPETPAESGLAGHRAQSRHAGGNQVRLGDADTPSHLQWWLQGPLLLVLLGAALIAFNRKGRGLTEDSQVFKQALQIWLPVIAEAHRTPRAVKRYLNWVRFLAMRLRDGDAELPQGFEATLVALSAKRVRTANRAFTTVDAIADVAEAEHRRQPGFADPDDLEVRQRFEDAIGAVRVSA